MSYHSVLHAMREHSPLEELRPILIKNIHRSNEEDTQGLDCLHHAIRAGNTEAAFLLLAHGPFLEPHRPRLPYVHFACRYGRLAMISILLRERPGDANVSLKLHSQNFLDFVNATDEKHSSEPSSTETNDITVVGQDNLPLYTYNNKHTIHSQMTDLSLMCDTDSDNNLLSATDNATGAMEEIPSTGSIETEYVVPIVSSELEKQGNATNVDVCTENAEYQTMTNSTCLTSDIACADGLQDDGLKQGSPGTPTHDPRWNAILAASPDLSSTGVRALDVAAGFGHVRCVRRLLEHEGKEGVLERAVIQCSSMALALMLKSTSAEETDAEDMAKAFKVALTRKLWRCMDLLLENGARHEEVLHGLNPYHVMFMYSSAFQIRGPDQRHMGLAETTAVLLRHGIRTDTAAPHGSYPLYSLLHALVQEKDFSPSEVPCHHIASLRLLLAAGVDTNYDETQDNSEADDDRYLLGFTVGRELYTSALNAVAVALQQSDQWEHWRVDVLVRVLQLLVTHGARVNHVDAYGDTPLHDLMKCLAMQHAVGNFQLDLQPVCRSLLQLGANPGLPSSNGLLAPHFYFAIFFHLISGLTAMDHWRVQGCARQVVWLLRFVEYDVALKAAHQISLMCVRMEKELPEHIRQYIESEVAEVTSHASSLLILCRLKIWTTIERDTERLKGLPLPRILKEGITEIFD